MDNTRPKAVFPRGSANDFDCTEKEYSLCCERYWCGHPSVEILDGQVYYYPANDTEQLLHQMHSTGLLGTRSTTQCHPRFCDGGYSERGLDDRDLIPPSREPVPSSLVVLLVADVPHHMSPAELSEFILLHHGSVDTSPNRTGIDFVKVLHSPSPSSYFCLLFCYTDSVLSLYTSVNNQPYNPLESQKCHLHLVKGITTEVSSNKLDSRYCVQRENEPSCSGSHSGRDGEERHNDQKLGSDDTNNFSENQPLSSVGCDKLCSPSNKYTSQDSLSRLYVEGSYIQNPSPRPDFLFSLCGEPEAADLSKEDSFIHLSPHILRRFDRMVEMLFQKKEDINGSSYLPSDFSKSPIETPRVLHSPCCTCDAVAAAQRTYLDRQESKISGGESSEHFDYARYRDPYTSLDDPDSSCAASVPRDAPFPLFCSCSCHAQPSSFHILSQSRSVPDECMTSALQRRVETLDLTVRSDHHESTWDYCTIDDEEGQRLCYAEAENAFSPTAKEPRTSSSCYERSLSPRNSSLSQHTPTTWSCTLNESFKEEEKLSTSHDSNTHSSDSSPRVASSTKDHSGILSPFVLMARYECPAYCAVCLEKVVWSSVSRSTQEKESKSGPPITNSGSNNNNNEYELHNNNEEVQRHESLEGLIDCRAVPSCDVPRPADIPVNILCGHTFHAECLLRWYDSSCPYCRYQQYPCKTSCCDLCGRNDNIKMCLVCGFLGCDITVAVAGDSGAPSAFDAGLQESYLRSPRDDMAQRHAYQHFLDFQHVYALEVESQRVWDFSRHSYVHRLLHNRNDGKVVEVAPATLPESTTDIHDTKPVEGVGIHEVKGQCCSDRHISTPGVLSKTSDIDKDTGSLVECFNDVLRKQLDRQREYFTERIRTLYAAFTELHTDVDQRRQDLREELEAAQQRVETYRKRLDEEKHQWETLIQERDQLKLQMDSLTTLNNKLTQSVATAAETRQKEEELYRNNLKERHETIQNLQSQIADVEFHLRTQRELVASEYIQPSSFIIGQRSNRSGKHGSQPRRPYRSRRS